MKMKRKDLNSHSEDNQIHTWIIERLDSDIHSVTYGGSLDSWDNLDPVEGAVGESHQSRSVSLMHLTTVEQLI